MRLCGATKMNDAQVAKTSAYTFSTQVATYSLGLIASIVIARTLGPTGKGIIGFLVLVPTTVAQLAKLGLDWGSTYYANRFPAKRSQLVTNALLVGLLWGGFCGIVAVAIFEAFPSLTGSAVFPRDLLIAAALLSCPVFLKFYLMSLLYGFQAFGKGNLLRLLSAGVYLGGLMLVVLLISEITVQGVFVTWVVTLILSVGIGLFLISREVALTARPDLRLLGVTLRHGVQAQIGYLATYLNMRLGHFFIVALLGSASLGLYSVSTAGMEILTYVPASVGLVLLPLISASEDDTAYEMVAKSLRTTLAVMAVASIVAYCLAPSIIGLLYGEAFLPAVEPFRILLIAGPSFTVNILLANSLIGMGRPMITAVASFVGLPATVILGLLLIPRLGLTGVAWAHLSASMLGSLVMVSYFMSCSERNLGELLILQSTDLADMSRIVKTRFVSGAQ